MAYKIEITLVMIDEQKAVLDTFKIKEVAKNDG